MELHQIRYFLAVERLRSFSRAAEHCNITQPALTRAIQRLEDEIGGKVFHRRPGKIELTELGMVVLPRLQSVEREIAQVKAEASNVLGLSKQRLRLGIMCTIGPDRLLALLDVIDRNKPDLELDIKEAKGTEILDAMLNDEIDAAVVGLPSYPASVEATPLYRERYVLAVASAHRLAQSQSVRLADLEGETYIERVNCEFDDHFEFAHGDWPVELNQRYRCAREDWVQAMVTAGLGIAILPESFPLISGVVAKALIGPEVTREISFVRRRGKDVPSLVTSLYNGIMTLDWSS